ncbi:MAG: hypothetical protein ACP5SB_03575 [Caldisericaceae bacterium]
MIILIAGAKSGSGKTTLTRILLKLFPHRFSVIKITPSRRYGQGIVTSSERFLKNPCFVVDRNELLKDKKDTYYFEKYRAKETFWVRGEKTELGGLLHTVLDLVHEDIIIEGNSFISYEKPELIFYVQMEGTLPKADAVELKEKAEYVIINTLSGLYLREKNVFSVNLIQALQDDKSIFRKDIYDIIEKRSSLNSRNSASI